MRINIEIATVREAALKAGFEITDQAAAKWLKDNRDNVLRNVQGAIAEELENLMSFSYPDCRLGNIMESMDDAMFSVLDQYAQSKGTTMEGFAGDEITSLAKRFATGKVTVGEISVTAKFQNGRKRKKFLCRFTLAPNGTVSSELDYPELDKEDPIDFMTPSDERRTDGHALTQ